MAQLFIIDPKVLAQEKKNRQNRFHYSRITPSNNKYKFASLFSESLDLFGDGYYYGCILLTQSVTDGLLKFLCEVNDIDIKDKEGLFRPFPNMLNDLISKGELGDGEELRMLKSSFQSVWQDRNHFHHLSKKITTERQTLEKLAETKLKSLLKIHDHFFAHTFKDGAIIPIFPKYWFIDDGLTTVFLNYPSK